MLTTIFSSIVDELTPLNAFLIIGASLLLGLLISLTYLLTHQKEGYTPASRNAYHAPRHHRCYHPAGGQ